MKTSSIALGDAAYQRTSDPIRGEFAEIDGQTYYAIRNVDRLAPFLMSVVSDTDLWLFVGSNSPFTAGRVDPDTALFPYQTVDKIVRHPDTSGTMSVFLVKRGERWALWEPWQQCGRVYRLHRHLYKHAYGSTVIFEETNDDLQLRFRWSLTTCERYGLVRRCALENLADKPVEIRYLDGWHQLLAPNISQESYNRLSYLANAYMRHTAVPDQPLGVYALNAGITDRAEPCESLRAAVGWSLGHPHPTLLLSDRQLDAFRHGEAVEPETEIRGDVGAYLVSDRVNVAANKSHAWSTIADTNLDHAALVRLREELGNRKRIDQAVRASVRANEEGLRRRIAAADGLQQTADRTTCIHHFANVTFNCMRGGTLNDSYRFPGADFASFIRTRNKSVFAHHRDWLEKLPETLTLETLHKKVASRRDRQLLRLAHEYLPVTFSRRHGDPSRPWNWFSIRLKDEHGEPVLNYQGNWRDIFQNWESLAQSYPAFLEQMITVFLNASTADGYNPYRITRNGVDWEVSDPRDPWSHIGYWGDHQIVYLLRLLESYERSYPGRLVTQLGKESYAYAHVPYEITSFNKLLADPRNTITFNHRLQDRLMARARELGSDGRLIDDDLGDILLVSLAEKLLVPLLVKLTNFVPEGGIWLNTQRPEWNDANNALAGWGLSMVTVYYIHRYLRFCEQMFAAGRNGEVSLSKPVAKLLADVTSALRGVSAQAGRGFDDAARFRALAALGRAGETHRQAVYQEQLGSRRTIPMKILREFVATALPVIEATIQANRREDGLYHSYNILHIKGGDHAAVAHLYPMLEGQVAVLSSGMLEPDEVLTLVQALRAGDLYRADQHSYLLYPDRVLPTFAERNTLKNPPPIEDRTIFVRDVKGQWHFQADLRNAADLAERLEKLGVDAPVREATLDLWEATFHHSEFTGRSGTFFMFEGLGCVYWHMVAKLLLAVQENYRQAIRDGADAATVQALARAYDDIRDGLGFRKTPETYGAFPTDPYSHTPRHRGAQQPGMTGQVKEEILTRWAELGVEVHHGCLRFAPRLLHRSEFMAEPRPFSYVNLKGEERTWDLPAESLAFTRCQVPVCYTLADTPVITIEWADGRKEFLRSDSLNAEVSASIFSRRDEVARLIVQVPRQALQD
ncbi:MAG TPA: hypothetical protein VMP11_19610 [Verrucomicrobiae bacterium]|nr:hypothetical protein [Verrucomicrobiae bacterium]